MKNKLENTIIKKIHISGGKGFIGKNISSCLSNRYSVSVSDLEDIDVLDKNTLERKIKDESPDLIIALAGLMGAQSSKSMLYKTFSVNSFGVLNILEAAHLANVQNVILFSSLTVHGSNIDEYDVIDEESNLKPLHPYATSKIIAEFIVREYSKLYQINVVILRPTIITGNLAGEENAVNEFTKNAYNDESIVIYGDGKHKREYISISDLVNAVEKSIEYLNKNKNNNICEPFIISSGQPVSMTELSNFCIKSIDRGKVKHIDKKTQAFSLITNINKSKADLGWEPKDNIDNLINNILDQMRTQINDN